MMQSTVREIVTKRIKRLACCIGILLACGMVSHVAADPVIAFNPATGGSGLNQNQSVGW